MQACAESDLYRVAYNPAHHAATHRHLLDDWPEDQVLKRVLVGDADEVEVNHEVCITADRVRKKAAMEAAKAAGREPPAEPRGALN